MRETEQPQEPKEVLGLFVRLSVYRKALWANTNSPAHLQVAVWAALASVTADNR